MTCTELDAILVDYLSHVLLESERARVEEHLNACPYCVAYLRDYRDTIGLIKDAFRGPNGPAPDDVPEELVEAILSTQRQRKH